MKKKKNYKYNMFSANPLVYLLTAVLSGVSSYLLFLVGSKIFQKYGLLDNPGPY